MPWANAPTLPSVVAGDEVEAAVIDTLKLRLPYYCEQVDLPAPRSWTQESTIDNFAGEQLPIIAVVCPGLYDAPKKLRQGEPGDGTHIANFLVGVAAIVSAKDQASTRKVAQRYAALVRATLLQSASLTPKGFARGVTWLDENYNQAEVRDRRTLISAETLFAIEVGGVVDADELPFMPDMLEIPTLSGVEADEAVITVTPMEED